MPNKTPLERFEARTVKTDTCWIFTGAPKDNGYLNFSIGSRSTKVVWHAHRYAYTVYVGEIPDGLEIDHLCNNRCCVNPAHLEVVTHQENKRRERERRPTCARGHLRTPENTYTYPKAYGARNVPNKGCKVCAMERARATRRGLKYLL